MSLGDSVLSGFNTGFGAVQTARDRKERQDEKELIAKLRAEDRKAREQQQEIADSLRLGEEIRAREERAGDRKQSQANADRAYEFQRGAYADSRLDNTMQLARQTRQDFSGEITAAKNDLRSHLEDEVIRERLRSEKMQNDAFGSPKPMQPTERLEYDPNDPTGAPKRILMGPVGAFGALNPAGPAPGPAPAASPGGAVDAYLAPAAPASSPAAVPATQPAPAPASSAPNAEGDAALAAIIRRFQGASPEEQAAALEAAGIRVNPSVFTAPRRTF